jgi:hypothetical protein
MRGGADDAVGASDANEIPGYQGFELGDHNALLFIGARGHQFLILLRVGVGASFISVCLC